MPRKPRPPRKPQQASRSSFLARIAKGILIFFIALLALIEIYAFVPIPLTPLMVIRAFQGHAIHHTWVPLSKMPSYLPAMALASEDNLFCSHNGFDFAAIDKALEGGRGRGASTISQQTAKNVFLWPGRNWVRKGLEVPLTLLIETLWGKKRIMEIYLNVAEFGPGIYGVGAAAKYRFHTTPKKLSRRQAALLIAILPNPLHWSPTHPGPYVAQRAGILQRRIWQLGPATACVR
jgi:monofunctional biosynthetic peptidoglycan transglycosylase